jgi:hypothetical protein
MVTTRAVRTSLVPAGDALATWIVTVHRMRGMDAGPGTDLGGLGWYVGFLRRRGVGAAGFEPANLCVPNAAL